MDVSRTLNIHFISFLLFAPFIEREGLECSLQASNAVYRLDYE